MEFLKVFAHQHEALDMLDDETCGKIFKAMMAYSFDGEDTLFDNPLMNALWAQYRNYIDFCATKANAGRISASNRKKASAKAVFEHTSNSAETALQDKPKSKTSSIKPSTVLQQCSNTPSTVLEHTSNTPSAVFEHTSNTPQAQLEHCSNIAGTVLEQCSGCAPTQEQEQEHIQEQEIEGTKEQRVYGRGAGGTENSPEEADADFLAELEKIETEVEKKAEKAKKKPKEESIDSVIDSYELDADVKKVLREFADMRKKKKRPLTARAMGMVIKKLMELAVDSETQVKIVEQSILHTWDTVYALKDESPFPRQIRSVEDVKKIQGNGHYNPFLESLKAEGVTI